MRKKFTAEDLRRVIPWFVQGVCSKEAILWFCTRVAHICFCQVSSFEIWLQKGKTFPSYLVCDTLIRWTKHPARFIIRWPLFAHNLFLIPPAADVVNRQFCSITFSSSRWIERCKFAFVNLLLILLHLKFKPIFQWKLSCAKRSSSMRPVTL